jgi:tryptophan-rich sensory protein
LLPLHTSNGAHRDYAEALVFDKVAGPPSIGKAILVAALAAVALAALGRVATDIGPWYQGLRQPGWKPPDAWFGPVWTAIYGCAATAGVLGWRAASAPAARRRLLVAFAANAAANVLWSVLFFRLRRPDWALAEVTLLWVSILVLVVMVSHRSRLGGALLVPYLAWVSFAAVLNAAVVALNAPFG